MVTRRGSCEDITSTGTEHPSLPFLRDALYVPRGGIMGADAASPTAERLTGPPPGSGMDGGVLLCQLVEGVSIVCAGGRAPCSCLRAAWSGLVSVRGCVCHRRKTSRRQMRPSPVDHASRTTHGCQKVKILTFFREAGDVEPFDGSFCLFAVSSCEFLVPSTVTYFPLRVSPTQLADCRA